MPEKDRTDKRGVVTKATLCGLVSVRTGKYMHSQCIPVWNALIKVISEELLEGGTLELRGFGTFYVYRSRKCNAYDFQRKCVISIPRQPTVRLRYTPELRAELAERRRGWRGR